MIAGITGPKGSGKSALMGRVAGACLDRGIAVGGVISLGCIYQGRRAGYELLTLPDGQRELLAAESELADTLFPAAQCLQYRAYSFSAPALARGREAIAAAMESGCLFIDEIGFWELHGGGWSSCLKGLARRGGFTLLGLRRGVIPHLRDVWGFEPAKLIDLEITLPEEAFEILKQTVIAYCKGEG